MIDFHILKELIAAGNEICIPVKGTSMMPFLENERDSVYAKKPVFPLKKGDIAFFENGFGRVIMHRIYRITPDGYYFCGDAMNTPEGPVREVQIFAVVSKFIRNGKELSVNSPVALLFKFRANLKKQLR